MKNYFEIFNLAESYNIDEKDLKSRYLELQKQTHPDKYINATPQEKRLSVQYAALLNTALKTLTSPVKRAAYLLELKGIDVDFEENTALSPEFLMEQMALREKAAASQDADEMHAEIENKKQTIIKDLEQLFEKNDTASLEKAKELTRQLKFFERLEESL